jgi:hypothetical protein
MRATTISILRRVAAAALVAGALGAAAGACKKSVPDALCQTICDCEHCSTVAEETSCAKLEADLKVATDYGCDGQWNAWADCMQGQGQCIADKALYSTAETGHCSKLFDIGLPCTATSDCAALKVDSATCTAGHCQAKQCEENGALCSVDADCPTGKDKCTSQLADLGTCERAASGHPGTISTGAPVAAPGTPSSPGSTGPAQTGGATSSGSGG